MADYYVDATSGNDANAGTDASSAWTGFANVVANVASGDRLLLKRGENWRETLTLPDNSVTVRAYGTGQYPLIIGSDLVTGWLSSQTSSYQAALSAKPSAVFVDPVNYQSNEPLLEVADDDAVEAAAGSWSHSGSSLYVRTTDSVDPTNNTIEASVRTGIVGASNASSQFVRIQNLEVNRCLHRGIYLEDTDAPEILSVAAHNCGKQGIYILNESHTTGTVVYGCDIGRIDSDLGQDAAAGILVRRGLDISISGNYCQTVTAEAIRVDNNVSDAREPRAIVENNEITDSDTGIHIKRASQSTTRYNYIHDSRGYGIGTDGVDYHMVAYNIVSSMSSSGWVNSGNNFNGLDSNVSSLELKYYNNTLVDIDPKCITVEGGTDAEVRNNILDCSDRGAGDYCFFCDADSITSGVTFSNNVYRPNSVEVNRLGQFPTIVLWSNYTSTCTDVQADGVTSTSTFAIDPKLTGGSGSAAFRIPVDSVARSFGTDVGLTVDFFGQPVTGLPDAGAHQYQAPVTSRTWNNPGNHPTIPQSRRRTSR
jgi:hypothetical protein